MKNYMRNGLVTPKTEGFVKQTQVMLLGGLCAEDMTAGSPPVSIKLEPLLSRFVWGKAGRCLENIVEFPTTWMLGAGVEITQSTASPRSVQNFIQSAIVSDFYSRTYYW